MSARRRRKRKKTISKIAEESELFFQFLFLSDCYSNRSAFHIINLLNGSACQVHTHSVEPVESRKHTPKWIFVANTCEQLVRTSPTVRVQPALFDVRQL